MVELRSFFFLLVLSACQAVQAGTASLSWVPPTTGVDGLPVQGLAGYYVKYGLGTGNYTDTVDIADPLATGHTVLDLFGGEFCFVVSAYNTDGAESVDSNEACKTMQVSALPQAEIIFQWIEEVPAVPTRSTTGDGVKPSVYTFDGTTAPWNSLNNGYIMEYTGTLLAPATLLDITGNGNTLTVSAGSIVEDGGIHGDLFNPGTNGASYNPGAEFDSLTNYTMIWLVKINSDINDSGSLETIGRIAGSTAQDTMLVQWHVNENVLFIAEDTDSGNTISIGDGILNNNGEYATVAAVVDGTNGYQYLYVIIDGEATQVASDLTSGITGSSADNDDYFLGHGTTAFSSFDLEANYFFDAALTQAQIEAIHTNPYSWNSGSAVVKTVTDSATGADTIGGLTVGVGVTDTGAGVDTPPVSAVLSSVDTAAGIDSALSAALLAVAEAAAGVDATIGQSALITVSDTAAGADVLGLAVSINTSELAAGVDTTAVLLEAVKLVAELGSGTDQAGVSVGVQAIDSGTAIETTAISVSIPVFDVATGADIASTITSTLRSVLESGTGVDATSLSAGMATVDTASSLDAPRLSVNLVLQDPAVGVDTTSKLEQLIKTVLESAVGVDAVATRISLQTADSAEGFDSTSVNALLAVLESAAATDITVRYAPGLQRIASITFIMNSPSALMALKSRSNKYVLN